MVDNLEVALENLLLGSLISAMFLAVVLAVLNRV